MSKSYYVYLHRTESGRVFYVGKGQGARAWSRKNRSLNWRKVVKREGLRVEIAYDHLQEWYALELEIETIARFGRSSLVNLTDGGEGVSGRKVSQESRAKMRARKIGKPLTCEHRAALSAATKGVKKSPRTPEHLARLRAANVGRKIECSNGLTFSKISDAEKWLRANGFPKASVGGLHTAAKNQTSAYGFHWQF